MNKNVVGIIIIVLALALVIFYAYPKIKIYMAPGETPPADQMKAPNETSI